MSRTFSPAHQGLRVIESRSLSEISGIGSDYHAVSPLAWARIDGFYSSDLLAEIREAAEQLSRQAASRYLDLTMLRAAHQHIPVVAEIMNDRRRLDFLSEVARTELEPYPIDVAACHINFYAGGQRTLAFHSDGAAMVELIPLTDTGTDRAGTVVFAGPRDEGLAELAARESQEGLPEERLVQVDHHFGESILLQGRRLLHTGSTTASDRLVLLLALRAKQEPWKDDNTIARLALDYEPEEFLDEWVQDELGTKLAARRRSGI